MFVGIAGGEEAVCDKGEEGVNYWDKEKRAEMH